MASVLRYDERAETAKELSKYCYASAENGLYAKHISESLSRHTKKSAQGIVPLSEISLAYSPFLVVLFVIFRALIGSFTGEKYGC